MSQTSDHREYLKRKREGKTDYAKRLEYIKSEDPRAVVRLSNNYVCVQIISYGPDGDKTVASAHSKELEDYGWTLNKKNTPAAYLTGYLCGLRAKKDYQRANPDVGLKKPDKRTKMYAAFKGLSDAGLTTKIEDEVVPAASRIKGEHIEKMVETNSEYYQGDVDAAKKATEIFANCVDKIEEEIA